MKFKKPNRKTMEDLGVYACVGLTVASAMIISYWVGYSKGFDSGYEVDDATKKALSDFIERI